MRKRRVFVFVLLLIVSVKSWAMTLNDGQYHVLDYHETSVSIAVDTVAESNPPTCLEIAQGGRVRQIRVGNTGRVIFNGGLADLNFQAEGNSLVTFLSGTLDDSYLGVNSSSLEMSGGVIQERMCLLDTASAVISGGILGGDIDIRDFSKLTFVGSDFMINGVSVSLYEDIKNYATYEFIDDGTYGYTGIITGTLADGSSLNSYFEIYDDDGESLANMYLVPEPCTILLFGVGGMVVMGRRRRVGIEI